MFFMQDASEIGVGALLGPENPIAGVAEAWDDIAMLVQPFVDRGGPDSHVRMRTAELADPFGRGERADKSDIPRAALLQAGDRGAGRIARRQHRIHENDEPVREILRRLEVILVIFDRFEGFGIAVKSDMSDARGGHEISMPSRKPAPARKIGARISFLPEITGPLVVATGVSTSIISTGRSRVTS